MVSSASIQETRGVSFMSNQNPFKWRHDEADIILLCVCWYLRYSLSYRDLEEMMREWGLHIDQTTIYRWVQHYAPEMEKHYRPHFKTITDSWRVDETYVKFKKVWMYLYRAVDSQGNTLELLLSPTRDVETAKRFFSKTLAVPHTTASLVITVDKNVAYPKAFKKLQAEGAIANSCELRQVKYLNNIVEQDHRFIKRRVKPGLGFFSFESAWNTLEGYEVINMLRKGQLRGVEKGDIMGQVTFIARLFGVAASDEQE
jgi:transposase, IS6 family